MRKRAWMLYFLLPAAAACTSPEAVRSADLLAAQPVLMTPVMSAIAVAADVIPVAAPNHDRTDLDAKCGLTHSGDQSRSPDLAVTDLHLKSAEPEMVTLGWTAPPVTRHLDGYEFRVYVPRDGARSAAWLDTHGKRPVAEVAMRPSRDRHTFEVVARYRYPLRNGRVYYWYGPVASTEHSMSANTACRPAFGPADTMPVYE